MYIPTISDQTDRTGISSFACYNGASTLVGISSRNNIEAEYDNKMTAILQQSLFDKQAIHFMPTDVSDEAKYINGMSTYILRISGTLINRQQAIVDIIGIKSFFDAEVPDNHSLSSFKTILARILFATLKNT